MPHGTRTCYNKGCRKLECGRANSDYYYKRIAAREELAPIDKRHGTLAGYNYWACRCNNCRAAMAAYRNRERN